MEEMREKIRKMKELWLSLILYVIVTMTCLSGIALTETASSNVAAHKRLQMQDQQQQPQQMQQFQQHYHPMSCYVCSTIEYDNAEDNICRVMKPHPRIGSGLHPQSPVNVGHLPPTLMNYPMVTSTTPTQSYSSMPSMEALVSESTTQSYQNESGSSPSWHGQSPSMMSGQAYSNETGHLVSSNSTNFGQQQSSIAPVQHGFPLRPHRPPHYNNHVRSRACSEDEHFCSAVSVVRIEFINDVWVSKFWALERNCSKSCNNGCMIIGEKVRLRICSQCCKHPNCNVGSGAPALLNPNLIQLLLLLIISVILSSRKLEVAPSDVQRAVA